MCVGLGAIALVVVTACSSGRAEGVDAAPTDLSSAAPDTDAAPTVGGRLVYGVPVLLPELVLGAVAEPLTAYGADGEVHPYLAESVVPDDGFRTWTITLRDGITFQNGEPLDAAVVARNLQTFLDLDGLRPIFGPIDELDVRDDRTLVVHLTQPWATFPAFLSGELVFGFGHIVADETLDVVGPLFLVQADRSGGVDDEGKPVTLVGTGPFVPQEVEPGRWLGVRNEQYWRDGLPYLDELEIVEIEQSAERIDALREGDVDLITSIDEIEQDELRDAGLVVTEDPFEPREVMLNLNTRRPGLDDLDVRRALLLGLDREAIAGRFGPPDAAVPTGPFAPGSPWAAEVDPPSYDPEAARDLIEAYEADHPPVSIELSGLSGDADELAVQQAVADQWGEIGVDVEVGTGVAKVAMVEALLEDFDVVLTVGSGGPEPDLHSVLWHSSLGANGLSFNLSGIADPALDEALERGRATDDESVRREAYTLVQARLAAVVPSIWLYRVGSAVVATPRVQGIGAQHLPGDVVAPALLGGKHRFAEIWLASSDASAGTTSPLGD